MQFKPHLHSSAFRARRLHLREQICSKNDFVHKGADNQEKDSSVAPICLLRATDQLLIFHLFIHSAPFAPN